MLTASEWAASVPATFTASQGRQLLEQALSDAHDAIQAVRDQFHGTVPPPPWPVPPSLQQAIDAADGGRVFFQRFETDGKGATPYARTSGNGVRLLRAGTTLYTEAAKLTDAAAKGADLTKLMNSALPSLGGGIALLAFALLLLFAWGHGSD